MANNTNELTAKLKAAAERVVDAYGDEWFEAGRQICTVHKSKIYLISRSTPANTLELIAALEAAQLANAAQADHINQQQSRINKLEKGHEEAAKQISSWRRLAKQNIAEREKDVAALDEARQRIADLESKLAQSESWSVSAKNYIASLEARAVKLPVNDIGKAREFYESAVVVPLSVVKWACAAAGINLETGG
ncbi:hypothetical protein BS421_22260, partial [Cronobacter sakazakii]